MYGTHSYINIYLTSTERIETHKYTIINSSSTSTLVLNKRTTLCHTWQAYQHWNVNMTTLARATGTLSVTSDTTKVMKTHSGDRTKLICINIGASAPSRTVSRITVITTMDPTRERRNQIMFQSIPPPPSSSSLWSSVGIHSDLDNSSVE